MTKVITFGEIMLRLSPHGYERFVQAQSMSSLYGGGEANVSVSCANYGIETSFVSKVPTHEIATAALQSLRALGVDTTYVIRGGDRLGIYYLERGASQRPSKVIYDRAGSAFALSQEHEYDWDTIFRGATWFHITGITPALSSDMAKITLAACKKAKALGITVSCDLNYRNKLWSKSKAQEVMSQICEYVDVCIANEEDAYDVFGIRPEASDVTSGQLHHDSYISVAKQLHTRFQFKAIAITLRSSISASENMWAAMLYTQNHVYFSKQYRMNIVDRVGGGDSFGGALIYSMTQNYDPQSAIDFATAASCLKHSIDGDFNLVSIDEVKKLASGDGSGRVQR